MISWPTISDGISKHPNRTDSKSGKVAREVAKEQSGERLLQQRASDAEREAVNGVVRGDDHVARGCEREAHDVHPGDGEPRVLAVARDSHDAAAAPVRSGDVEIAFAVERESVRPAQALEEDRHATVAVNALHRLAARDGRPRDVQVIVRPERKMRSEE